VAQISKRTVSSRSPKREIRIGEMSLYVRVSRSGRVPITAESNFVAERRIL
jgi:hypothetical protein